MFSQGSETNNNRNIFLYGNLKELIFTYECLRKDIPLSRRKKRESQNNVNMIALYQDTWLQKQDIERCRGQQQKEVEDEAGEADIEWVLKGTIKYNKNFKLQ